MVWLYRTSVLSLIKKMSLSLYTSMHLTFSQYNTTKRELESRHPWQLHSCLSLPAGLWFQLAMEALATAGGQCWQLLSGSRGEWGSVTTSGREGRQRGGHQPTRGLDTGRRPITSGELASIRTDLGKCAIGIDITTRIVFKSGPWDIILLTNERTEKYRHTNQNPGVEWRLWPCLISPAGHNMLWS